MINGICHTGAWGSLGSLGGWGWTGLILSLAFWVALLAGLVLLVLWAIRRARVHADTTSKTTGQPTVGNLATAKETLQTQYARGEITREQYELRKQEIG